MINESCTNATISSITINIDSIDVYVNQNIFVGLFILGLFWIVKVKLSFDVIKKTFDILQTFFSKVTPILVDTSLQVLKSVKIKRTLLLAGLCVLFIIFLKLVN